MPYITKEEKKKIDSVLQYLNNRSMTNAGTLNYAIHQVIDVYITSNKDSYQTYNDIMGALEGVKMELYRRKISEYEDEKLELNGDVKPYLK